jgi:hypothetical protein
LFALSAETNDAQRRRITGTIALDQMSRGKSEAFMEKSMTDWQPSSYHKKGYGRMGSISADPNLCAEEVASKDGWAYSQCSRKRGHGPEQAYCKQHDPDAVKAKREANAAQNGGSGIRCKDKAREAERAATQLGKDAIAALQAIADGHNDPRGLAQSVMKGTGND